MKGRIGEEEMKRRLELFLIILLPILGIVFLGGKIMTLTKRPEQKITASSSKKVVQKSKEEIKKEQIAYLKEHEQEIVDFVKAQNPKVESVQIDWDQTQWSDGGLTTPEYYMNVYGRINHIEESGWGVNIPINEDNTLNMDEMYIGSDINIGGRLFD
ncbi:hypothetical protein [Streptococcus parasanguinis]|uniref:hypothetical protein n=1 Tax=Streptococcus parasanguinis TaxID=1318 RepID=UPI003D2E32E6